MDHKTLSLKNSGSRASQGSNHVRVKARESKFLTIAQPDNVLSDEEALRKANAIASNGNTVSISDDVAEKKAQKILAFNGNTGHQIDDKEAIRRANMLTYDVQNARAMGNRNEINQVMQRAKQGSAFKSAQPNDDSGRTRGAGFLGRNKSRARRAENRVAV